MGDGPHHALRSYQQSAAPDRPAGLHSQGLLSAHADSDEADRRPLRRQVTLHLLQTQALLLRRPADDHRRDAAESRRLQLLQKAAGGPALLGHKVLGAGLPDGRRVHFTGKRPLHADQMGGRQPQAAAFRQLMLLRKNARVKPLFKVRDFRVLPDGLAPGEKQNRAFRACQV